MQQIMQETTATTIKTISKNSKKLLKQTLKEKEKLQKRATKFSNKALHKKTSFLSLMKKEDHGQVDTAVIDYCWIIKFNNVFKEKPKPFTVPRLKQTFELIGPGLRCRSHIQECKSKNIAPYIDFLNPIKCQQIYGAPLGGIGTGSIGRTFTGDFARYQLIPGIYEHNTVEANMFTVCIRKNSRTIYQQALTTKRSQLKGFKYWNMAYSGEHATYYALYPESWIVYDLPGQNVLLTCHQLSPIIPNNYKDSSLPVGLFNWTVENNNSEDIELSLMFTWQSGSASDKFELSDVSSKSFSNYKNNDTNISGVLLSQKIKNIPLQYCIAAKNTVIFDFLILFFNQT